MDIQPRSTQYSDDEIKEILDSYKKSRQEIIYPYAEKLGNCRVVCLGGDHMIYEQRPEECAEIIMGFLKELDS